jgi:rhodanese-related sulfurtransferase
MAEDASGKYAGDASCEAAWAELKKTPQATLVDVRTAAEWAYVGVPSLSTIGKAPVLIEWDRFPSGELVPDFLGRLKSALDKLGVSRDAPLYFICRSGNRSRHAAIAAAANGYRQSFNVEYGFEGRLSPDRHRATTGSWKASGLPWVQS